MHIDQLDWIETSAHKAMDSCEITPVFIVGSMVAGCIALAASGHWLVAGGVTAAGVYLAEKRHLGTLANARYAIDYGAAPVALKGEKQLREYSDHMGQQATAEQLLQAARSGVNLNRAALNFLDEFYGEDLDKLLDQPLQEREAKLFHTIEPIILSPNGNAATGATSEALPVVDVADRMGQNLKPTIIAAMPRTGKGILVAHGWRAAKKYHPELKVYVIDPKAHPDESGYWDGCDRVLAIRFDQVPKNCPDTIAAIESFIQEWRDDPAAKKLLIFDEQVLTEAKLPKWYKEYAIPLIKSEGSAGETFHRYIWVVMPSPLATDIGLSGGNRSVYIHCALATNRSTDGMNPKAWMNSAKASQFIPSIPPAGQFEASPRGTLCYSSLLGEWVALPEYPVPAPRQFGPPPPPKVAQQPVQVSENLFQPIQPPQVSENLCQPIPNPPELQPPSPQKVETALEAAAKELIAKLKASPEPLKEQYKEIKTNIQQLVKDKRDDLLWIAALSVEKGEITARMVRERFKFKPWFKALETTGENINKAIRLKFSELSDRGIGDCFGEGNRLSYLLFTGDERVVPGDAGDSGEGEEGSLEGQD